MHAVGARERGAWVRALGVEPGLCGVCRHAALLRSRRSAFLRCRLADADPAFRCYPALPVERCAGFEPDDGDEA